MGLVENQNEEPFISPLFQLDKSRQDMLAAMHAWAGQPFIGKQLTLRSSAANLAQTFIHAAGEIYADEHFSRAESIDHLALLYEEDEAERHQLLRRLAPKGGFVATSYEVALKDFSEFLDAPDRDAFVEAFGKLYSENLEVDLDEFFICIPPRENVIENQSKHKNFVQKAGEIGAFAASAAIGFFAFQAVQKRLAH